MKKIFAVLLSILMVTVCLAACGKKEEEPTETLANDPMIIGTWMEDYWDSGYTFREDGTGKDIFWSQDFTFTAVEGSLKISYVEGLWAEKEFTYTIEGNVLTLTEVVETGEDGAPAGEAGTWDYTKSE